MTTNAVASGIGSEIQGGKFGHGFASAAISGAIGQGTINSNATSEVRFVLTVLVGGTVSEVTGGKFANGAVTSAMAFAFNQVASSSQSDAQTRGRSLLLGEGESPEILTDKVVRHRLGLLSEELDALIADLSAINDPEVAANVFSSARYSSNFDAVYLQGVNDTVRSLKFVRAGISIRRGLEGLDALGGAAIEVGLTRGAGRLLRTAGAAGTAAQLSPYHSSPHSRPAMQRTPSIACADVARCAVAWR